MKSSNPYIIHSKSVFCRNISNGRSNKKNQKTRWFYFIILLLGGPFHQMFCGDRGLLHFFANHATMQMDFEAIPESDAIFHNPEDCRGDRAWTVTGVRYWHRHMTQRVCVSKVVVGGCVTQFSTKIIFIEYKIKYTYHLSNLKDNKYYNLEYAKRIRFY